VATYCHTAADRDAAQAAQGGSVTRFKGLGEMAAVELWATTMDPNRRRLVQVTVEDEAMAEAAFTTMMGDNVEARRQWLGVQADRARARQDEAAA
jgi:DNA gyrase subunit B